MAPTAQQALGRRGEQLALEHYERLGFELLARNRRTRSGEVDLVVANRRIIVFAEVKSARVAALDPLVSITPRKLARMRRVACEWLAAEPRIRRPALRLDVVAVVVDANDRLVALEQFADVGAAYSASCSYAADWNDRR
jgi:putative endonuclease